MDDFKEFDEEIGDAEGWTNGGDWAPKIKAFITKHYLKKSVVREKIEELPSYEVQDDVKTKDGKWEEFFQVQVIKKDDILKELS